MYAADLTPYTYGPDRMREEDSHLLQMTQSARNVGWLGSEHPWPRGGVPDAVVGRLLRLGEHSWLQHRGYHGCWLETHQTHDPIEEALGELTFELGSKVTFVPDGERWFACPDLIAHYIRRHGYRPPDAFLDAVVALDERHIPDRAELQAIVREMARRVRALGPDAELERAGGVAIGASGRAHVTEVIPLRQRDDDFGFDPPDTWHVLLSVKLQDNPLHTHRLLDSVYLYPDGRMEWSEARYQRMIAQRRGR